MWQGLSIMSKRRNVRIGLEVRWQYAAYKLYDDNSVELNSPTGQTVNSTLDESGFISGVAGKGCPQK